MLAATALRDEATVRQRRAREARSASASPFSSISSVTEYRELRTPVWMARSASDRGRDDAPAGMDCDPKRRRRAAGRAGRRSCPDGSGSSRRARSRALRAAVPVSEVDRSSDRASTSTSIGPPEIDDAESSRNGGGAEAEEEDEAEVRCCRSVPVTGAKAAEQSEREGLIVAVKARIRRRRGRVMPMVSFGHCEQGTGRRCSCR